MLLVPRLQFARQFLAMHATIWILLGGFAEPRIASAATPAAYQFLPATLTASPQIAVVQVAISGTGPLNTIKVVTEGAANLDFSYDSGGTCSTGFTYSAGQSCSGDGGFSAKIPWSSRGSSCSFRSRRKRPRGRSTQRNGPRFANRAPSSGWRSRSSPVRANIFTAATEGQQSMKTFTFQWEEQLTELGTFLLQIRAIRESDGVDAATGIHTTVAGKGVPGYDGDGGQAAAAMLCTPSDVKLDGAGDLFIADSQNYTLSVESTERLAL